MRDLRPRPERVTKPSKPKRSYVRKDTGTSTKEGATAKKRRDRILKKQQETQSIVGRGTPSELTKGCEEEKEGFWRGRVTMRPMNLEDIVERDERDVMVDEHINNVNIGGTSMEVNALIVGF